MTEPSLQPLYKYVFFYCIRLSRGFVHMNAVALGGQRHRISLELGLQALVDYLRVLGIKLIFCNYASNN